MSSYRHEMGFLPQDARLEPLYSRLFARFFWQFSDCVRVTGHSEIDPAPERRPVSGFPTIRETTVKPRASRDLIQKTAIFSDGNLVFRALNGVIHCAV